MKVISVVNQKGGVGKTTTVSNLLAYFTEHGNKVLGIDIDSQGHLTKLCGINTDGRNTILEILQHKANFADTIVNTELFGDIIAADRNLGLSVLQLASSPETMFGIKELLEQCDDFYDYVIIDCPPAVNVITVAALVASDYVLIPSEAEYFSLDGVTELAQTINSVRKRINPTLKVLGILLVKYSTQRKLTKEVVELLQNAGQKIFQADVLPVKIRATVDIPQAQRYQQSIFAYKPTSKVAKEYAELGDYIAKFA